jgi:hypothetical protein
MGLATCFRVILLMMLVSEHPKVGEEGAQYLQPQATRERLLLNSKFLALLTVRASL